VLKILNKPESLIRYVTDRAGHDRRYGMNIAKLHGELGWQPRHAFEAGLETTVQWYLDHRAWWERVVSEAYRASNALYLNSP
jgi:dTDP-glucose 4,6-dehydratase